jgi:indole-3-glycerol phosphate synthase
MTHSMPTILDQIVRDTLDVIRKRKSERSVSNLENMAGFSRPAYSLESALSERPFSIIAEAKKASPSKGIIRDPFDPIDITSAYQRAGAAAVSILTEPLHFKGDINFLSDCRPGLSIPILRKDFIVDPYQITEARALGADAILLIASILDKNQILELQDAARQAGLSVLLEVYAESELERVDVDQTPIIGANSRDLHTFEVNLEHAIHVLNQLPSTCLKIAESGIGSTADVQKLKDRGIDGALIGESFMRQDKPGDALASYISAIT